MILVPFLMVIVGGGSVKALKGMVGITLVSGVTFVIPQLIVAKFTGPELAVIVGCVVSLGCTILMARARKGREIPAEYDMRSGQPTAGKPLDGKTAIISWLPFILIFVLLLITSKLVPPVNSVLAHFSTSVKISTSVNAGNASFSWINTPGIWIFVAAIIGGIVQKASAKVMAETLAATVKQMSKTIITIMSVLAVAKIMTYCGMINDMATFFVSITGKFYPFVAPIIAALGAFITGSGTSTEVLLGALQTSAAQQIGTSEFWLAAANSTGAGIGKILSPQCIATAAAAVGLVGQDSKLLGGVIKWALLELVIACLIVGRWAAWSCRSSVCDTLRCGRVTKKARCKMHLHFASGPSFPCPGVSPRLSQRSWWRNSPPGFRPGESAGCFRPRGVAPPQSGVCHCSCNP